MKVAFDAGHGKNTSGKRSPDGEREWCFNNKVAVAFEDEIKCYINVEILRTDDRTGKTDVSLKTRTDKANNWDADIYISFHHNASTGKWGTWTGTETFYYAGSSKGKALAQAVHNGALNAYGLTDRKLKTNNLHITRETKMPSCLVEGGFMDSTTDIKKMRDDKVLANAGKNIATEVAKLYGLKKKTTTTATTTVKVSNTYKIKNGDTLSLIAKKYGVTVDDLKSLNNIKDINVIKIGETLKIPSSSVINHVVKKGENLSTVAKKYGTTVDKIVKDNGIKNPNVISIGQVLMIKK